MIKKQLFAISVGGAIGALLRYMISLLYTTSLTSTFPYATLTVNLVGCFLLPFINFSTPLKKLSPSVKAAISTGIIGSFTTFSTFSVDSIHLFQVQAYFSLLVYLFFTLFGGLLLSGISLWIVNRKDAEV